MYGIVSREGTVLWTVRYATLGAAKLAVRNNNFTYAVCVAKIEEGRAAGEIYEYNADMKKWEVVNNG